MKLTLVVQRCGEEVQGGAEALCRAWARRLAARHEVEILTTCALDYTTWADHYPPGPATVDGLRVTRFPVTRARDPRRFALYSDVVLRDHHTPEEERTWIEENGPVAPALVEAVRASSAELVLVFSYRYWTSFHAAGAAGSRAVLVPTAEDDPVLAIGAFAPVFRSARGHLFLTPEERDLVQRVAGDAVPHAVIGSGVDLAPGGLGAEEAGVAARFGLAAPYVLYVGRLDGGKGVDVLARDWLRFCANHADAPVLALAGRSHLSLPEHPKLRVLGPVDEAEKRALLAGCQLFVLPSPHESLSIAVLEAWALGRPVLANGRCAVLAGQCARSDGGLWYEGYGEFEEALRLLLERADLRVALGRQGREFVRRECSWEAVDARLEEALARFAAAPARA
ncbi:MAG: glycosyltransferase family 4 protein [Vicinamibacteria bacterium]|nr:glycosyltransferase family 4 protein [Vicinamibacteria bacterium]